MPKYNYAEAKHLLDTSTVSNSLFLDLVKESLITSDSKFSQDLIKYSRENHQTYSLEIVIDLLNSIPVEEISTSIDLIKKLTRTAKIKTLMLKRFK